MDPEMIDKAAGGAQESAEAPFWKRKGLTGLTDGEWESLCDGCGRCCLNKLEDWDTGEIAWTSLACTLFDAGTCRCGDYENRLEKVPDCLPLTPETVPDLTWLPPTCGYRLVGEGRDLYWWHPLVSGDPGTVHAAGISARGKTFPEDGVPLEDYENFLVDWPGENPMEEKVRAGFVERR
jgi:uncharacterized cysteine cluster protein YcgN (CxxCxxCC family)